MSEDIGRQAPTLSTDDIINRTLILLEDRCTSINNKILCQLGMPAPIRDVNNVEDRDILREKQYNVDQLRTFVENRKRLLVLLRFLIFYVFLLDYDLRTQINQPS